MNNILFCWRRTHFFFFNFQKVFIFFCISYSLLFTNNVEALDNRLEKISFSAMVGNRVQVQLSFARRAVSPLKFSTDNPARIVLDFPKTKLRLRKKSQSIGIGVVQGTRAVEARDRTRVVLNLIRMVPFNIKVVGKKVLVSIENRASQPISVRRAPSSTSATSGNITIQDIDFQRTETGAGRIAITLSAASFMVDMHQESSDIVLEFPKTSLPSRLDRRLNVLDFGTPISFIDAFPEGDNVRINVTVKGNYEHHAFQTKNIYFIEVKEKSKIKPESLKIEERKYEGQLVSFNFQDIDVRAVLKLLFDLPGVNMNMIAGAEVKGSVSLRLKNVPWDQALDILLEARDLGMRKIGNVVMIDLKKNIEARKQREFKAQQKLREIEPLHTEFIVINYAKAADIASLLKSQGGGSNQGHSFLSDRGAVSTDERTNTLIIQDTASKITEIRKLIASLDTPIRQVLIESRIVIATSNFTKALGVKFGYSLNKPVGNSLNVGALGGKLKGDTDFGGTTTFNDGTNENYIVSLPAAGATGALGLAIGKIGSYLLQLELSAMQTEGSGEIVSSPRLITGNQQEASIMQGTQIAFLSSGGVGTAGTVEWKDATVELKVTPQITPDDRISLELAVKKDAPGAQFNGQTSIDKRELQTNVLVNNGETVVLGGVYERTRGKSTSRVPFFADLPLIGFLFRNKSNKDDKSELLIFVTPKIIKETN
jgi:type IV pilus assembly protein PilQ